MFFLLKITDNSKDINEITTVSLPVAEMIFSSNATHLLLISFAVISFNVSAISPTVSPTFALPSSV